MIWWSLLTGCLFGILTGEAWIHLRDAANTRRTAGHANEPTDGSVFDWLTRRPSDLDRDRHERRP